MNRAKFVIVGSLPLLLAVVVVTTNSLRGSEPARVTPTTTTMPPAVTAVIEKLDTGARYDGKQDADVEAALRLVARYDPKRLRRMERTDWLVRDCGGDSCTRNLALTYDFGEYCVTELSPSRVRKMAQSWDIPYVHWLAVTLVHEESHCHGTNERQALGAEIKFEQKWPTGAARTNALRSTFYGYGLLDKNGDWR